jgi:hypothetical protein
VYIVVKRVNLARLYTSFALVDQHRRQRAPIATDTSQQRNPFPVTILYSRRTQFCLLNCLRKHAFTAYSYADKEALLIYIIAIAQLYIVLLHFAVKEIKV